ncbi:MAG: peptidylprolyl isomerase [Clostridiales bacterium]|nr:peptidylprolyl isomerase [Candidatus Coliplasma equi]
MKDTVLAEIEMKDGGVIKLELYHNIAPITVENFVKLAESGFYDGLIFHRVISGFMIQGGDPKGNGTGGPGYTIKGEFAANGIVNNISHKRGVISMARRGDSYDSAGSQFFIMHVDYVGLDGQYAAFGKVTEGLDIVDRIAAVATDYNDKPLTDQTIKTIRITDK